MSRKWALVALLAIVGAGIGTAHADDAIKLGKWQYTATMQLPYMPQSPPAVQLPPNVQMQSGSGGMTVTTTHRMEADVKTRLTSSRDAPMERTMHATGQYLGPCYGN